MMASKMEVLVHNILEDYNLPYQEEYIFPDLSAENGRPLRFDFCVFDDSGDIDFLIECQGEQHYSPVKKFGGAKGLKRQKHNDVRKRRYCQQHNYHLICIPFYDENKINYDYIMKAAGY